MLKRVGGTLWRECPLFTLFSIATNCDGLSLIVPTLVVGFGLVCLVTAFITSFGGFMAIRVLLGLFEGGMMPGITYYLSTWYRRHELALRIGIFVSAASLSGAFGGLLATAFLSIPQIKGL
jgi:MFS family permease